MEGEQVVKGSFRKVSGTSSSWITLETSGRESINFQGILELGLEVFIG